LFVDLRNMVRKDKMTEAKIEEIFEN